MSLGGSSEFGRDAVAGRELRAEARVAACVDCRVDRRTDDREAAAPRLFFGVFGIIRRRGEQYRELNQEGGRSVSFSR